MFISDNWKDYELLYCGAGEKYERWGDVTLRRPDPQAVWPVIKNGKEISMVRLCLFFLAISLGPDRIASFLAFSREGSGWCPGVVSFPRKQGIDTQTPWVRRSFC